MFISFTNYVSLLSQLTGGDLNGFRLNDSDFYHVWLGSGEPGEVTDDDLIDEDKALVSESLYCAFQKLATQIDAVLIYFENDTPTEPRRPIGFR